MLKQVVLPLAFITSDGSRMENGHSTAFCDLNFPSADIDLLYGLLEPRRGRCLSNTGKDTVQS